MNQTGFAFYSSGNPQPTRAAFHHVHNHGMQDLVQQCVHTVRYYALPIKDGQQCGWTQPITQIPWVGAKNFGFTEEQKNIEQGSIKLKELHVCIMRVQKKMAAWRSEVP